MARTPHAPHHRVLPSRSEPMARGFVDFLGGPPGRHAIIGRQNFWTPLRVLLAWSAVFLSLGWMQKANCVRTAIGEDGPFINWAGQRQYTSACYSDVIVLYQGRGFGQLGAPYSFSWVDNGATRYLEYPVVTGLFQWVMAAVTKPVEIIWNALPLPQVAPTGVNFAVTAVFLAACWMASCAIVAQLAGNRTWDTVLMAASPLVIVHAFTNYDTLSVLFAVGCLALWAKNKPGWAGVIGGLGIAAKLWPAFVIGALILLCLRTRAWAPLARLVGATVASWAAINLPIYLTQPQAWGEFFRLNSSRGWEGSTIYAVLAHITGQDAWNGVTPSKAVEGVGTLNAITFALLLICLCGLAGVVIKAQQQPCTAQVAFLAVLAFMITNKVWSPQYSLWLLPLLVLALPRWRLVFSWAALEAVYWYLRMWTFLPAKLAAPDWLVDTVTVVRLGLLIAMAVIVVRQMLGRTVDTVREAHGGLDPLAGPCAEQQAVQVARPATTTLKENR